GFAKAGKHPRLLMKHGLAHGMTICTRTIGSSTRLSDTRAARKAGLVMSRRYRLASMFVVALSLIGFLGQPSTFMRTTARAQATATLNLPRQPIRISNASGIKRLTTLPAQIGPRTQLKWSPDGTAFAVCCTEDGIAVYTLGWLKQGPRSINS